tara:strand:+ start:372 stop:827 length:456 start_codon:yes stop_codon:yes gene_type:complete
MKNILSFNTKFSWISATEINNKITKIQFRRKKGKGKRSKNLENLKKKIISFFQEKTNKLDIKIFVNGSFLQKKIWRELKKIKKGEVKSYGEIAKKLKISPRYVGRVCGENKHVLVIPCHRIIKSNNTLGGFSATGGIELKKKLLKFEGIVI